jgi:hypothetical protein
VFAILAANTQRAAPTQSTDTTETEYAKPTPLPSLKSFIQTNIRQILLGSDLDCYSRQATLKNHAFETPFSLMKVSLYCHSLIPLNVH